MSSAYSRLFTVLILSTTIIFLGWVAFFNVNDSDFWWNLKAGQIMLDEGWIETEPFAYTREGQSYLATQSWLGQVILALVFNEWGFKGVIGLRTAIYILTFICLLLIDKKRIWPNAFLVMAASIAIKTFTLDRPLIWTFLFLAIELLVTHKILDSFDYSAKKRAKNLFIWLALLILFHVVWINLHGGAAFINFALLLGTILQRMIDIKPRSSPGRLVCDRALIILFFGLAAMFAASFASPNGGKNIAYVFQLFADKSKDLIVEWQPLGPAKYLTHTLFFWLTAAVSFSLSLRKPYACGFIFLVFAYMSSSASRHIPLFIIVASGLTIYQLKYYKAWQSQMEKLSNRKPAAIAITMSALAVVLTVNEPPRKAFAIYDIDKSASYEPAAGAYRFIEENEPHGNMFNSYGLGSYLLYRGYPKRKVYLDGRNVDYGYEFIKRTLDAKDSKDAWAEIEKIYNPTYAIISYRPPNDKYPYRYAHLDENPNWALVFIDENVAIYYKNIPEHKEIIREHDYRFITSKGFGERTLHEEIDKSQLKALANELMRQIETDQNSINSHIMLAKIFIYSGTYSDAKKILDEAIQRGPGYFELYELLAKVYEKEGQTEMADEMNRKAIRLKN